ncbi:MAG: 5'-methylthioadenosine/adenosylhomocysteine nucleosidase [Liquorilactobacillus hordei]|uniref:adenosylhomocysteine nucleosidase n=1 Tax=Liquorilactobacillus hordei DSM 19519 TaxID=1423759 RepID=A0A0R1MID8_9LACO|nr:5'-methylthioadenosine/adenosylhomocysteine nucleosidase [Liquorilactobacillus hordei]KRL07686.1 5-methylthioadenosine nucleosidase S-adenosylhomocysteine nucleosidase [Liquorilactobacillus hordei DSM 19519]MBZ2404690.1 5'-methylthioadenosine/adenosylhomocysteine nucleosidase [Liquorilactobacillus hordei]QYH52650.1 5'-methylthioadenosine/adenosylhomocysteine nucleosidase [Liquorilactobacillus hordei DSM 19519]
MKYGILCAMDEEIKALKTELKKARQTEIAGITFFEGKINNNEVVLVQSGIGKVQAGMTTGLLIAQFEVEAVINSGSAGGIGEGLHVGDVVLSTAAAYHDVDATVFGYLPGQLPQQPQKFEADLQLIETLKKAAEQNQQHVETGLIVTGDQFVASSEKINTIKAIYPDVLCCEMEGAAIAQVAAQFKVPFVIVRAMSDTGDEEAGVSFDEFIIEAGKKSAQMILNVLAK